ncbi:MAG: alanine dehydrogenase [candidate division KSB1 bacterium]|nr:alanine dehydrogenase [candidate division KSB1 bacterium]MDZ7345170.1 alanine dehydrogenase [candidate division KSB1 bacterium]
MIIGVPKEIKANENRIAVVPAGAEILARRGHTVLIEKGAGEGSGFNDDAYRQVGAKIVPTAADVYAQAQMIMKVKEPLPQEYPLIRRDHIVFTYFHFAASRELTEAMIASGATCIAYETVEAADGSLPLLVPMSEVAGRMAVQEGAKYLEKFFGGRGLLLGGIPGVKPANVVILGGGVVGSNAAKIAAGMGANVTILDINLDRLRYLDDVMPKNVTTLLSSPYNIRQVLPQADLVIGAVLLPGAKAPHLITRDMLKLMQEGAVIVDVAVDQGGCVETIHPTTHENPTYVVDGVIHYGVANMPGAVPRTSTIGLTNATLPYALQITEMIDEKGRLIPEKLLKNIGLAKGVNIINGKVTYKGVAEAFDLPYVPLDKAVA